jgi:hypothetical protein
MMYICTYFILCFNVAQDTFLFFVKYIVLSFIKYTMLAKLHVKLKGVKDKVKDFIKVYVYFRSVV